MVIYKIFGCLFVWIISTKVNKDELKNVPLKGLFCRVKKSSIKTGKYVKCNSNWISSFSLRIDRPAWYCLKIGNPSKLLTSEIMMIFRDGEKIGEWYEGTFREVNAQKSKSIKVNILRISLFYVCRDGSSESVGEPLVQVVCRVRHKEQKCIPLYSFCLKFTLYYKVFQTICSINFDVITIVTLLIYNMNSRNAKW